MSLSAGKELKVWKGEGDTASLFAEDFYRTLLSPTAEWVVPSELVGFTFGRGIQTRAWLVLLPTLMTSLWATAIL